MKIGIDLGTRSIKAALKKNTGEMQLIHLLTEGQPVKKTLEFLEQFDDQDHEITLTGAHAPLISEITGADYLIDPLAMLAGMQQRHPDARTAVDIGHQHSAIYFFDEDEDGVLDLVDWVTNSKCGGGAGAANEKIARRLGFRSLEEYGSKAFHAKSTFDIADRCAVFARTDANHRAQLGQDIDCIASGVCQTPVKNLLARVGLETKLIAPVYFLGATALNPAVEKHLQAGVNEMQNNPQKIIIPEDFMDIKAIGALHEASHPSNLRQMRERLLGYRSPAPIFLPPIKPITPVREDTPYEVIDKVNGNEVLLSLNREYVFPTGGKVKAFLGLDVGSVSSKIAVMDENGTLIYAVYERTEGRPIEVVPDLLERAANIEFSGRKAKDLLDIVESGATGSGRGIAGAIIGSRDVNIKNEITAQAQGALFYDPDITDVLELGGQDAKWIRIRKRRVVDFAMNKGCMAGTGSNLEEQAEVLKIDIKRDFARLALAGKNPPKYDDKCAVFMAASVEANSHLSLEDQCAGISYSTINNLLKHVAKEIGERPMMQGAPALNGALPATIETILGRPVIVADWPHATGAIGMAKWVLEYHRRKTPEELASGETGFRGFDNIKALDLKQTLFKCKGEDRLCTNACDVTKIKIGESFRFSGDICERYSGAEQRKKSAGKTLFDKRQETLLSYVRPPTGRPSVGIPRIAMFNDLLPLWATFLDKLGYDTVVSDETNPSIIRDGMKRARADFCFPFKVAFGHVHNLAGKADYIFVPDVIEAHSSAYSPDGEVKCNTGWDRSATCPFLQNFGSQLYADFKDQTRVINPHLSFKEDPRLTVKNLQQAFRERGLDISRGKIRDALEEGEQAYYAFKDQNREEGAKAIEQLKSRERGVVIAGRPYTTYDPEMNLNLVKKIAAQGYVPIPLDYMPLPREDLAKRVVNEFSIQGQYLLGVANMARNLGVNALFLSYFNCGPNTFIGELFTREIEGQFMSTELDGHRGDAGLQTRVEAWLDSVSANMEAVLN